MTLRSLLLGLCLLAAGFAPAARAAEREFKQTFPVLPGCTVKVDSYRGAIVVVESDELVNEVQVYLHMEIGADSEAEADRRRDELQLDVSSENNVVSLRARNPAQTRVRFVWNDKNQLDLAWKITVPRRCHVEASTVYGSITIGNLTGSVTARIERGPISIKNIDGNIDAAAQFGDIVISRCSGIAKLRVLKGLIRTGSMFGFVDAKNTNGDVEVMAAYAGITALAEAGDAIIGFPRTTTGEARITTNGGSIRAKIDPAANCAIDATATWGRVETQLPLAISSGASGKSKLTGQLGHGGATLTLRASGGQVRIVPGDGFM